MSFSAKLIYKFEPGVRQHTKLSAWSLFQTSSNQS